MERLLLTSLGSSPYSAMVKLNKKRAYFQLTNNSWARWMQNIFALFLHLPLKHTNWLLLEIRYCTRAKSSWENHIFLICGTLNISVQYICTAEWIFTENIWNKESIFYCEHHMMEMWNLLSETWAFFKFTTLKFLIQWLSMSRFLL